MEIDYNTGVLKVQYNEKKIVTLIKDVRQLTELGFKIPKQLTQIIENVRKFYREGVTLRQVANFFNNMSSQIMECHNTMLLRHTIAFEKIIKNKSKDKKDAFGDGAKDVTWTSPVELEEYIQEVQEASNVLMKENRKLRKMHVNIVEYIVSMMNTDLLKNKEVWKEKLNTIKKIVDSSNYSAKETKTWRTHLDYQLYKALETQYRTGMKNLNENFNMIEADLVYRDKTVSFNPPMEQLKTLYYKEISNFINIPIIFSGLGGRPSIFKIIPNRNSESLLSVYAKAEEVFSRLEKMINTFIPWTAIGYFDLETYIEEKFKDVKDWENNFKMLRVKRKQLEKLNESYKIDSFFNIRTEPFKKGIEDLFHRTHDILKQTLKSAIKTDMEAIDQFIDDGMKKLNARPQSVEEIGKAKAEAVEISGKKNQFVELYNQCEERNRVLQQVSGEGAHIGEMQNRWENFDVALNAFSSMIDEQKNVLKQETDKRVQTLNSELEKTFNRWEALKPKETSDMDRETAMETSEKMKEWREKWEELESKIKNITADCEHFGIEKPEFTYYEDLKNDLAQAEESWRFYDEFYKELEELGKEDWLSFSRGKGIYQFQDFMDKWEEKIKKKRADTEKQSMVDRLLRQAIDNFKEAWPLFKICVGEAFEKEHWRALFYMLNFPKEVNVENLKFGHFLDSIENMVAKAADVKDLGARAQGEISIREAIQELRAWCDQTEFALTEYIGGNNRTVPLIKDWKELMNQVSDNQSLLISLKESRFFSRFSDQVEQFESKLTGIDEYLHKLNIIQRKWVYLEPIFIRGALPAEQARFNRVDGEYVSIMMGIGMNPKVIALCDIQGLKETLDTILSQLDVCQKALNDFLEEKRSRFPRFYFIGDDDLLEILGQATNPRVIQTHLKKLFAGIFRVDFNKDNTAIVAMKSSAGEVVELSAPVQITEDVEIWLGDLVNEMRQTLSLLLKTTLNTSNLDIVNTPSQVCCLAEMVHFSNNTIQAINKGKLSNYKIDLQKNLENYTSFDHGGDLLLLSK